jgi:hypothetical protein
MKKRIETWLTTAAAVFAAAFLLYVLTAPPVMMGIARQRGSLSFPAFYQPIVRVLESDFNGPLLWYFNGVWHSGIVLLGEESTPPRIIVAYTVVFLFVIATVALPFVRSRLRRVQP